MTPNTKAPPNRDTARPRPRRWRRAIAAGALAAAAMTGSLAGGAAAAHAGTADLPGTIVFQDGWVGASGQSYSTSSSVTVAMQTDGNLVEYAWGYPIWASATVGHGGAYATFANGVLSVVDPSGTVLWRSAPQVGAGAVMYLDRTLHIHDANGNERWFVSSGVGLSTLFLPQNSAVAVGTANHQLVMQDDGNLVFYNAAYRPIWATGTYGHNGQGFNGQFTPDGDLEVNSQWGAVWFDPAPSGNACVLNLQNDGNIVIISTYNNTHNILWASGSFG